MSFELEHGDGSLVTPIALAHPLHQADQGRGTETCWLGDVFIPDDLNFGPKAQSMLPYICCMMATSKAPWHKLLRKDLYPREVGIATVECMGNWN